MADFPSGNPLELPMLTLRLDMLNAPPGRVWLRDIESGRLIADVDDVRVASDQDGLMIMTVRIAILNRQQ